VVLEVAIDGAEGFRKGLEREEDDRLEVHLGLSVSRVGVAAVIIALVHDVFLVVVAAGTRTTRAGWARGSSGVAAVGIWVRAGVSVSIRAVSRRQQRTLE
jgi:hypothetical protein